MRGTFSFMRFFGGLPADRMNGRASPLRRAAPGGEVSKGIRPVNGDSISRARYHVTIVANEDSRIRSQIVFVRNG